MTGDSEVDRVEAVAKVLNPRAFDGSMLKIGCGSGWHYESHSSHSACPACPGSWDYREIAVKWCHPETLAAKQAEAQEQARSLARKALTAMDGP